MNAIHRAVACLGLTLALFSGARAETAEPLRRLEPTPPSAHSIDLSLEPHMSGGVVNYVDIRMVLENPRTGAGRPLIQMPLVVASIPTQRYDGDALQAKDGKGELPLIQTDGPQTPFMTNRLWSPSRPTIGDVILTFRAKPRDVNAKTRPGPLFDLRAEDGGLDGAGFSFLPVPDQSGPVRLHLHWNLSQMPAGARGVWSFGEGDVTVDRPVDVLQTSYYFAGPVKSWPATATANFGMYWLSDPPFDAHKVATTIRRMFEYMAAFFKDEGGSYRVFVRKQPYHGDGGTALTRSFMFGWSAEDVPTDDHIEGLLAHEMVHNWPKLDGDHAVTSWYSEGTAEYYSILLSLRAGLSTPEQFLERVNGRAADYYRNPLQNLSNTEAEKVYWQDPRASHVPYGRGFMYLANVDYEIRAASNGRRSLRDVVLALKDKQSRNEAAGVRQWVDLVAAEVGPGAQAEYDAMASGQTIVPRPNVFAPCFRPVPYASATADFGFDVYALQGPDSKVEGLVAGSAAAAAGLRNGDDILKAPDFRSADTGRSETISIKIRRDGREQLITYRPMGAPITAWRWERVAGFPDSVCHL